MSPERWQRIKEVVASAAELESEERAQFVARECSGDMALQREVESMLGYAGDNIERAAEVLLNVTEQAAGDDLAGARFGAYEIVRELGRGGMGAVYLARRADEQFRKEVALKILKRGTDTDEVLSRFRAERQILARLEHPNIARLLDAGTTDDGLPYFVMEYVAGVVVTDFCVDRGLSIDDRLQLFLKISGAVSFAHQNLVVHRDLKPGNILVTAGGEPKLLDFGIAKLLAPDDSVAFSMTLAEHQRLTPGYASPEQVRGEAITTVSDVYSLGALLYELLSGKPAHKFATVRPSPTELLRVIGEETPPRPSAAATDPAIARRLRGDLDNIVLQALRKEPARRYPGVNALAEDIRRHVANFPVRARRDTAVYRASKFVRRHALGVSAAGVAIVALVAALWMAQIERGKAIRRFEQVRQLARSVMFDYHDQIAALPGSTAVRQTLVRDALKYLDNLSKEASDDRDLLRELADAYEKVAAVQGGAGGSARGVTVTAANLGDTAGAVASHEKAIVLRVRIRQLGRNDPADMQALGRSYVKMSGYFLLGGPPDKALDFLQKGIPVLEALLALNPQNEEVRALLANAYLGSGKAFGSPAGPNIGDTTGALEYTSKALHKFQSLTTDFPTKLGHRQGLAATYTAIGSIYSAIGPADQQLENHHKAVQLTRTLVAAEPQNAFYRRELAVQLGNLGNALVQSNDQGALEQFREALALLESLVAADPNDVGIRRQWAVAHRNLCGAIGASDRTQALQHLQKAMEILSEIVAKDPKNTEFRRQWALTYLAQSRFEIQTDEPAAAVASAGEGIRIGEELVTASRENVAAQNTLAQLYGQLGGSYSKAAEKAETPVEHLRAAKDAYRKSLAIYEDLKAKGKLAPADANKLDELTREIATCDAQLRSLTSASSGT